ncbi:hypothetical protein FHR92_002084 [Fontibacillus solani]|uniref:YtkA-like domain-containing protein n=1 Tax=Fontibacillus solani TaxID=1572857 RepID=A0A7W3SST2_9BACL|nr:FixH family protein [Fontibacillus solani]MBA9085617.1 hypothetical protein [Fontibacillus solani]
MFTINRAIRVPLIVLILAFICGCTAQVPVSDRNGFKPHLNVDLQVTSATDAYHTNKFSIFLTQEDVPYRDAAQVQFEVWPEGNKDAVIKVDGKQSSSGLYTASYSFSEEGIYIVKGHVSTQEYQVMPSKRFAVGNKAVEELIAQEQASESEMDHTHAEHHH